MNAVIAKMLDASAATFVAREQAWLPHDQRGRWVVIEPGVGRHLKGAARELRRWVDRVTPRRGRRFSSLARARAFARSVGGTVHRWRRTSPSGSAWQWQSPWQRAAEMVNSMWFVPGALP